MIQRRRRHCLLKAVPGRPLFIVSWQREHPQRNSNPNTINCRNSLACACTSRRESTRKIRLKWCTLLAMSGTAAYRGGEGGQERGAYHLFENLFDVRTLSTRRIETNPNPKAQSDKIKQSIASFPCIQTQCTLIYSLYPFLEQVVSSTDRSAFCVAPGLSDDYNI